MPQQPTDWQTISSGPDDWQTVGAKSEQQPNWWDTAASAIPQPVKSMWNLATKPLTDYITDASGNRIFDPKAAANYYDDPSARREDDWKIPGFVPYVGGGSLKSLGAGMLEGAGDVVSGLTSPLNLATLGAFKGASSLAKFAPTVAKGLQTTGRALSAPIAAHGAATASNPNASMSERMFGIAELAGGGAGMAVRMPQPKPKPVGAGALEGQLPVKQPAAPIEPSAVTPDSLPVRPPAIAASEAPGLAGRSSASIKGQLDSGETPVFGTPDDPYMERGGLPPKGAGEFDPSTLQGLEQAPKPELQFLDPATGEMKSALEAKPGDIPLPPEAVPDTPGAPPRRARNMILTDKASEMTGSSLPPEISTASEISPKLPANLAGAKPRFNAGTQFYNPQFANDLDKSLFIIAQTRKSAHDARYLKFVMEQTGLDESGARALGQQVKTTIKETAKNTPGGDIQIPSISGKMKFPKTGVSNAQDVKAYLESGKPLVSTGEVNPANVRPAAEVVDSLSKRLQKATENPDPVKAPEDISGLLKDAEEVVKNAPDEPGIIRKILGANKALLTAWDLSAPGRQGKAFIMNKAWWTSLDDMVKAWGSETAAGTIYQSIIDHPSGYFKPGVSPTGKATKSFAENIGLDLASTEEMFRHTLGKGFEKYSGIGMASRAHTAFLNKLRSDQFVSMMDASKKAGMNPETNTLIAQKYATFINNATGRGSVNIGQWKLERNTRALNDIFFAPKNMSGQIRTWNNVLNPLKYKNYDSVLRKQALTSLFAVAGMGLGVGELARLAGAKVSNDPTSSDFRKIKIGDVRIDPFGGYQQFPVAAMKFMMGQSTSTTSGRTTDLTAGRFGQTTRQSVVERFFTNRLSPLGSFIWAWMGNSEFDGKPFEVKRGIYERVFPIAAKDILDMAQENPALAAALAIPTTMGLTGTQTYTGR